MTEEYKEPVRITGPAWRTYENQDLFLGDLSRVIPYDISTEEEKAKRAAAAKRKAARDAKKLKTIRAKLTTSEMRWLKDYYREQFSDY